MKKSSWTSYILPIALALCLFAVVLISGLGIISRSEQTAHQVLQRQVHITSETIDAKIESLYESIEALAPVLTSASGLTKEQTLLAMNALRDAHGLDFVVRTDTSGMAMNYLGNENIDLSQRAYIHTALSGKRAIELVASGAYDSQNAYVIMAAPIMNEGTVEGVLHGSYKTENFVSLLLALTEKFEQGCDEINILTDSGEVIASNNPSLDADALGAHIRKIASEHEDTDASMDEIETGGQKRQYYINRIKAGTNSKWYVAARVSQEYLDGQTAYAKYSAIALIFSAVVITIALLYISINRQRFTNEAKKRSDRLALALADAEKADIAKSQFLSRMSHEIRTPLNAVIGYNTIARNEITAARSEEARKRADMKVMDCLTKSEIASKHLLTIINDVLEMSAIESGKIKIVNERFDFKGLVNSLTAVFYSQAKAKGVALDVIFESEMDEWLMGDQMRVSQVLTNLLSNAVKFTPDGGTVTLSIHPTVSQDSVRVRFAVRDTGIGMSHEYMERLWKPFEQADSSISRRFGGTGLGLSITNTLVSLMNGTISAVSEQGQGSTFTVELSFERTEQPAKQDTYDFSSINALIVDDDAGTCDYVRLLLERSGVSSTGVTSGADAIAAVSAACERNEPYTVCLVDWRMPKMDGIETVQHIRDVVGSEMPIIVISAYDLSEVADKATELGVDRFISKPLFQSTLFDLMANISGSQIHDHTKMQESYHFPGVRVLLCEDNMMNMEIAKRILESAELTVDSVWNGREALDKFAQSPAGTYGAILMDVQMPVMDGYTATREIRRLPREDAATIPIIAMTADAFAENIAESMSAGMNDHVSKPIDLPTLFKALKKYLK